MVGTDVTSVPTVTSIGGYHMTENEKNIHEEYMRRAIELAERGRGFTDPNPVVGAVIVKDGKTIGEGWHERYGELHAERNAIANCKANGNDPAGAVIYVTLEPCCHHGKTPPCTDAIIENGICHVYIGSDDPNPEVAEKSEKILTAAGIGQTRGILKQECDALNTRFFHFITTGLPFVTLKYAMTADGKIASSSGRSQWITGPEARAYVHRMRHEYPGIMAGIGTVLADDPMLNCRLDEPGPQGVSDPTRIIMDTNLRIPLDSQIVRSAKDIPTIIVTAEDAGLKNPEPSSQKRAAKEAALQDAGCTILKTGTKDYGNGHLTVDAGEAIRKLGEMKISAILVEGGGTLNYSILRSGMADHAAAFIAPKILGGAEAKTPVEGPGFDDPNTCPAMEFKNMHRLGKDILLEFDISK